MSMFSGLTGQISAFVASKTGGEAPADPNALGPDGQPLDPQAYANAQMGLIRMAHPLTPTPTPPFRMKISGHALHAF